MIPEFMNMSEFDGYLNAMNITEFANAFRTRLKEINYFLLFAEKNEMLIKISVHSPNGKPMFEAETASRLGCEIMKKL